MLKKDFEDLDKNGTVGDWAFTKDDLHILVRLPDGLTEHGDIAALRLEPTPLDSVADWQWNGNREAPSLTPSINWVDVWHGYLTDGKLVPA